MHLCSCHGQTRVFGRTCTHCSIPKQASLPVCRRRVESATGPTLWMSLWSQKTLITENDFKLVLYNLAYNRQVFLTWPTYSRCKIVSCLISYKNPSLYMRSPDCFIPTSLRVAFFLPKHFIESLPIIKLLESKHFQCLERDSSAPWKAFQYNTVLSKSVV